MIQFWSGGYNEQQLCQLFQCLQEALNYSVDNKASKIVIHDLQKVVNYVYDKCPKEISD